jgi:hypothetical protein
MRSHLDRASGECNGLALAGLLMTQRGLWRPAAGNEIALIQINYLTEGDFQMSTIVIDEPFDRPRRRFFGTAAMTLAAAQLGLIGAANTLSNNAKAASVPPVKPGTHPSRPSSRSTPAS